MLAASTLPLRPSPHAPREARRFVAQACDHAPVALLEDALLLTSELVTNAVLHGRPPIELRVHCPGATIHVEVWDYGTPSAPPAPATPCAGVADAPGGRGLQLLAAVAARCGSVREQGATVVWFTVEQPAAGRD